LPPELSISSDDAHGPEPERLDELIYVLEIATIGFVAAIAARLLGLSGLDALLAIFFSTTLAGQFLTAVLGRMRRS
jgi:hypothetical protein